MDNETATTGERSETRKRKKDETPMAPSSRNRKRLKSLSELPTMPVDILFEIFSHLTSRDLLMLSRTTKAFRALLHDRRSMTVWMAARHGTPGAPDCPDDVSEPFWANLVFGETKCEHCDRNARRIFFELRCRLCVPCVKEACLNPAGVKKQFPRLGTKVLDSVPYVILPVNGSFNAKQYRLKSEVQSIAAELQRLLDNVTKGVDGAADALEAFSQARIEHVKSLLEYAQKCRKTLANAIVQRSVDAHTFKEQRLMQVCARFEQLGYDQADVRAVIKVSVMSPSLLTERAWKVIQDAYEELVVEAREARLEQVHKEIREARRARIGQVYWDYRRGLRPLEHESAPPSQLVYAFSESLALVNRDPALKEPTDAEYDALKASFPLLIARHTSFINTQLLALREKDPPQGVTYIVDMPPELGPNADATALDLAIFVTLCWTHIQPPFAFRVLLTCPAAVSFGRREALMHLVHGQLAGPEALVAAVPDTSDLYFMRQASVAARALALLAGLDPATATPDDMDTVDARFVCETCRKQGYSGADKGQWVMNWRQCVTHCLRQTRRTWEVRTHQTAEWRILGKAEREAVREAEELEGQDGVAWCCNHCIDAPLDPKPRAEVVLHLATRHDIHSPVNDQDLFVYRTTSKSDCGKKDDSS
ncbi:hypothetical protein C8Q78DRAFT_555970 [Trametes maxima]|nr:hypothetical protein C8Q78DRAFT_555970 [Trametes maxima]